MDIEHTFYVIEVKVKPFENAKSRNHLLPCHSKNERNNRFRSFFNEIFIVNTKAKHRNNR